MKRVLSVILTLVLLLGLAGCYVQSDSEGTAVEFTLLVRHSDGSEKRFNVETKAASLGEALLAEGLIEASAESDGMYDTVDGEQALWSDGEAWWCFFRGDESLTVGLDETKPENGVTYAAIFARGMDEVRP